MQNAIAERVVSAIALQLRGEEKRRLTKLDTTNPEAYQLYLKGRYYWWKTTPEEFRKCRDYFQRAVDADPCYALGSCGLNAFFCYGSARGKLPPDDSWPRSVRAAGYALELHEPRPQRHNPIGDYLLESTRHWAT